MLGHRIHRHGWTLLTALALGCTSALASEERWFQVELLVFAHQPGDFGERFAATPALAYPDASRFLIDPERVAANAEAHPGTSVVNAFGRQIIEWQDPSDPGVLPESDDGASEQPEDTFGALPVDPNEPGGAAAEPAEAEDEAQTEPIAFVMLPESRQEFRGKAAYMQRSGRYRILFHESWVQPVRDEASALPIVLDRSGDDAEPWPELQGSIKLHLARYLHLETNLWLNTDGSYLGPSNWRMPMPPRGPQSLVVEEPPPEPVIEDELLAPAPADDTMMLDSDAELFDPNEPLVEPDPYPYRHAVLLQQKRRMRSEEVHYIDHPLFGVVARLIPVDIEELLVQQAEEAAVQEAAVQKAGAGADLGVSAAPQ